MIIEPIHQPKVYIQITDVIPPNYLSILYAAAASIRVERKRYTMTTLDLNTLETALTNRARDLVRSLAERNQIAIETAADTFDATLLAAGRESSAQSLSQEFSLLRQVEAARDRIHDGSYGVCLRCEVEIPPKRLHAIPWAAYCLTCQALSEEAGVFRPNLARAA